MLPTIIEKIIFNSCNNFKCQTLSRENFIVEVRTKVGGTFTDTFLMFVITLKNHLRYCALKKIVELGKTKKDVKKLKFGRIEFGSF